MSHDSITEAIRILLGSAPKGCVEAVSAKVKAGTPVSEALSQWLQEQKLVAAKPATV